jgi:hypothetical protein
MSFRNWTRTILMRLLATMGLLGVLLLPSATHAQAPEALLPGNCQVYLRWDGWESHKAAYARTALGKTLSGDLGPFLAGAYTQIQEGLGTLLTVEQLLGGANPERLQQMSADAAEAAKLFSLLGQKGFLFALDVATLEPPDAQMFIVVPDLGETTKPFLGAFRLVANLNKAPIKEEKVRQRTVYRIDIPFITVAWWIEGKHGFFTVGTRPMDKMLASFDEQKGSRLNEAKLFTRVSGFKEYETAARMFVDVASLVKLADKRGPDVKKLLDDLGLYGIEDMVLYSGFDGDYERGLIEIKAPGARKGLLGLFKGQPFQLADLPPMPPDVTTFSMSQFDAAGAWDLAITTIENFARLVEPDDVKNIQEGVKVINQALGIDLRKDLLESLGDRFLMYNSPDEGPLTLGQVVAIKVKNAAKLQEALESMIKGAARSSGADVRLKKRTYRGVELREVHVKQQGFTFTPTFTIHKDWLVVSLYPQPVHGYILRATGEIPAWKPDARVAQALERLPKEYTSIAFSDPRPTIKQLLSLAPFITALANSFSPEQFLDIGTVPNAQEATRHLFPSVSVTHDKEGIVRLESRAALSLPLDLAGVDTYGLLFLILAGGRF